MSILAIIVTIVIVGVLLWLINTYIPMDAKIKNILNIVVIVFLVIWLLRILGVWGYLANAHV